MWQRVTKKMWNQARFTPQVLLAELCPLAFWIRYETTRSGPLEYFTDYFKKALLESAREGSIKYGQFANEVLSDSVCQCTRADSEKVL